MRQTKYLILSILLVLGLPQHAMAFGAEGHQVIANVAYAKLTLKARAEVDRLLSLEPGATLASISTWADEHRNPSTAKWHYVNFPRGNCTYDAERDCPDGKCVVGAIDKQSAVLASSTSDESRLIALKYLVHFVGDVHQPLHAGYLDDKGGNTYQLQAFMRGSNLHAVWDSGLIRNLNEDAVDFAKRLIAKEGGNWSPAWTAVRAAEESCRIVGIQGFYPDRLIGQDYIDRFTPTVVQRLSTAGYRLSALLNAVLK
jgi:hypothetical protein